MTSSNVQMPYHWTDASLVHPRVPWIECNRNRNRSRNRHQSTVANCYSLNAKHMTTLNMIYGTGCIFLSPCCFALSMMTITQRQVVVVVVFWSVLLIQLLTRLLFATGLGPITTSNSWLISDLSGCLLSGDYTIWFQMIWCTLRTETVWRNMEPHSHIMKIVRITKLSFPCFFFIHPLLIPLFAAHCRHCCCLQIIYSSMSYT